MKCISVASAYLKQTREFIAVILIGMTSISVGVEPPKLLPLPPIAPGLQLSRLFNDHMVLQRETPLKIWGWAASGEKLTVEFAEQKKSTTVAADGSWQVVLDPMPANAIGRTLTVTSATSNQQSAINDVLVGEVWLLGGQSNMALPLSPFRTDNWPNQ